MITPKQEVLFGEIHKIGIDMERLQKVIAKAGITSRRKAEELITSGKVKVNGVVVTELGTKVEPSDEILVEGKPIRQEEKVYYMFYKPKATITSVSDTRDRTTVLDYFSDVPERVFPVGRLDYNTTGLLLLTNDGDFAQKMMHPRTHIPKTYQVKVEGVFTDGMVKKLEKGILIDGIKTLPAEVERIGMSKKKNRSELIITIYEGRNREIRKMMEYFHCKVLALHRISYGNLELGNLKMGEYRKLRSYEVKKLLKMVED